MLPYHPHPLLRNGHLQTLLVGLSHGDRPPHHASEIQIALDDGERLVVHEENGGPLSEDAPTAILVHGLGGNHRSPYLQRIAKQLRIAGVRTWRVDLRGSGAGINLAWRPAHAGCSSDLAAIVRTAHDRYPNSPIRICGFSLGGNVVLKLLGESAPGGPLCNRLDVSRIEYALAVAPPINLHDCANNMDRVSRRIYTSYYLKVLDKQVELRRTLWPAWRAIPREPKVKSIRQFDARYTAPLSGFSDANHYYHVSSSDQWLTHIRTQTTILVDRHDPIVTAHSFERVSFDSQFIHIEHTSHGGHLGYLGIDDSGKTMRWMDYYVINSMKQT
jgi:predicted alpha/beta-fold hydrolase